MPPRFRHALVSGALVALSFLLMPSNVYADDPTYPKPNPAQAFAALKVYDATGSPLRIPREDWDGAKKRVKNDAAWAKWLQEQQAITDDWIQKRRDHVEWQAGWYHDFVSPKDGSTLIWTPDEPGQTTLRSASDPQVELTPKLRAAWNYQFRASHGNYLVSAARLYRVTGDKKYAEWAAGQLDFYADHLARWPVAPPPDKGEKPGTPPVKPGWRLMSQSLDEAVLIIKFVSAARILGDYVTPERKARWFTHLFQPEAVLLSQSLLTVHNMACWQRSATACVALYYDDAALWKTAVGDRYGVKDLLAKGVTSDYLWREQSLGYNAYVTRALMPLFEFACLQGKGEKLKTEMEIIENLLLAPIAMRFTTGQLPSPADGGRPKPAPDTEMLAGAARLFPTKIGLAAQETAHTWESLIDPLPAASEDMTLSPVSSWNMESSRMAIIKQGKWQVYFHYGQIVRTHSQSEALNYEAFYDRTDVTHDPGTGGYGANVTRDVFVAALAHNVPLIDGVGQEAWNPGKLLTFDAGAGTMGASQPTYRKNAAAQRTLQISGEALRDTVQVTTNDSKTHELGLLVQIQGKVTLPDAFRPDARLTEPSQPAGFAYWKSVASAEFTDSASFNVTYPNGQKMRVTFTVPGTFTVLHGDTPDAPPERRETLFVRVPNASQATFKTTWLPLK